MKRINKKHIYIFIVSIISYLITYFLSTKFFYRNNLTGRGLLISIFLEIIYFILLVIGFEYLSHIFNKRKEYKKYIISFSIFFIINLILLFLVWPGVWRWDEIFVAVASQFYTLTPWQHSFTTIYYMIALRTFPCYVSIIILQIGIISMICSYVVNKIKDYFNIKNIVGRCITYIPLLLPAVLINNMYPLRSVLYSYLILLFIIYSIDLFYKDKINIINILFIGTLFGLLSTWRSEGIYFIVILFIYSLYLLKIKKINIKYLIILLIVGLGSFGSIYTFNKLNISKEEELNYKLTSTIEISAELVRYAAKDTSNVNILKDIDRVIDIDRIINTDICGTDLYWMGVARDNYNKEDFKKYNKAFYKLAMKYPDVLLEQRWYEFSISSGLIENKFNTVGDSIDIFNNKSALDSIEEFKKSRFIGPLNKEVRSKVIKFMETRSNEDIYKSTKWYGIRYNLIIPIVISFIFCLYLLFKKKVMESFIFACSLMKAVLVYITAPSGYFMYYFSDYLVGYICLVIIVNLLYNKFIGRKS